MNKLSYILILGLLFSCKQKSAPVERQEVKIIRDTIRIIETKVDTIFVQKVNEFQNSEFFFEERLPEWFLQTNLLNGIKIKDKYRLDSRINPLYLEEDFNGDGNLDIAIPIIELQTDKYGFAIIHGKTNEVYIIGAGTKIKNGLSDNMRYINIWKINRKRINEPGIGEEESLILDLPSIQIEKSEVGGGQIYWDGHEYKYYHQTC